jgi:hypothetical protein
VAAASRRPAGTREMPFSRTKSRSWDMGSLDMKPRIIWLPTDVERLVRVKKTATSENR